MIVAAGELDDGRCPGERGLTPTPVVDLTEDVNDDVVTETGGTGLLSDSAPRVENLAEAEARAISTIQQSLLEEQASVAAAAAAGDLTHDCEMDWAPSVSMGSTAPAQREGRSTQTRKLTCRVIICCSCIQVGCVVGKAYTGPMPSDHFLEGLADNVTLVYSGVFRRIPSERNLGAAEWVPALGWDLGT